MYRILLILLLFTSSLVAQMPLNTYRNPVIAGDIPDPTVIRVGTDYYAAGTTSDFAPNYPLFHSTDLINWERIGSVFTNPPEWIKGDCWAPELYYHEGTYFVYYTARRKSDNITCIGVATTKDITKGFTDHGILIEWGSEAIDAYIFKDDDGKLYITWKAYGLDPSRPIEILASELSNDGLSLIGEHFTLTNHEKGWKGYGDEGQVLMKHGDYYYHFYSVGGCCDNRCDYRVEVARSKSLRGDWEQYSNNPILQGGELWRCSGHGTLVQVPDGRYFYLYHAYHAYDFEYIGRQGLLDELVWDDISGWPYFKNGNTPSSQSEVPFPNTVQVRKSEFHDSFTDNNLDKYWIWDMNLPRPVINKQNGILSFAGEKPGICFRGVNPQTGNYTMETGVLAEGENLKGLSIYGNRSNQFVWGVEDKQVKLYKIAGDSRTELFAVPITEKEIYLQINSINGRLFRFLWSTNQKDWQSYPTDKEALDGYFIPQWGKGVRCGLFVENKGNDKGEFSYFLLKNKYW